MSSAQQTALDAMPADLAEVATRFLELHDAHGTRFKTEHLEDAFSLLWNTVDGMGDGKRGKHHRWARLTWWGKDGSWFFVSPEGGLGLPDVINHPRGREPFWRSDAAAEYLQGIGRPDPRLAQLPEDLRAVAVEFLSLHDAWETEFSVHGHKLSFGIDWPGRPDEYPIPFAELKFVKHEVNRFGLTTAPWYCAWRIRWVDKDEAGESVGRLPALRRSADFAEFVQRFREGGE